LTNIADRLVAGTNKPGGPPAFEFHHWMAYLESREREALTLRFVEEWEYHEIAAAKNIPIGTVQWRVFNAKKKLASYLKGEKFQSRFRPKEASTTSRALDSNKTIAHLALPC
jgi:predicted DNA-binding protein (UPF0251 family)